MRLSVIQSLIALITLITVGWHLRDSRHFTEFRRSHSLILLTLSLLCLTFATFEPKWTTDDDRKLRVLVFDRSLSYSKTLKHTLARPQLLAAGLSSEDLISVVSFAQNSQVQLLPAKKNQAIAAIGTLSSETQSGSNLNAALRTAFDLVKAQKLQAEIVLLTDALETHTRAEEVTPLCPKNTSVYFYQSFLQRLPDSQIRSVQHNGDLRLGDRFSWQVAVASNYELDGEIIWTLSKDNVSVRQNKSQLKLDSDSPVNAEWSATITEPGHYRVTCQLKTSNSDEQVLDNNKLELDFDVSGKLSVLCIGPRSLRETCEGLALSRFSVQFLATETLGLNLNQNILNRRPDAILIADVSLSKLDHFHGSLSSYLKTTQTQLIYAGNPSNLVKTDQRLFESLLPIKLETPSPDQKPTHLVIAIDCSGSMEDEYFNVLNACRQLPQIVDSQTELSIFAFNSSVRFRRLNFFAPELDRIIDEAAEIKPSGPTSLSTALQSIAELWTIEKSYRHRAILLSDGRNEPSATDQDKLITIFHRLSKSLPPSERSQLFLALIGRDEVPSGLASLFAKFKTRGLDSGVFVIEQMKAAYERALVQSAQTLKQNVITTPQDIEITQLAKIWGYPSITGQLSPIARVEARKNSQVLVQTKSGIPVIVSGQSVIGRSLYLGAGLKSWTTSKFKDLLEQLLLKSQTRSDQQVTAQFEWIETGLQIKFSISKWQDPQIWTSPWQARWVDGATSISRRLQVSAPGQQSLKLSWADLKTKGSISLYRPKNIRLGQFKLPKSTTLELARNEADYQKMNRLAAAMDGSVVANLAHLPRGLSASRVVQTNTLSAVLALTLLLLSVAQRQHSQ